MSRPPIIHASYGLPGELVADLFAGGGGASTGIEAALGRPVDLAINHSAAAIALHRANHPETKHYQSDVREVDPREACGSRPVGLLWASPDCTHHSRARGGKPRDHGIRSLAWVVVRWAKEVRPRIICVENVEEFRDWGPLDDDGQPIKARAGETFRQWVAALSDAGYRVDFRTLVAADYGTPTTRKRLFLVARRDGAGIAWPEPTHGQGRTSPWRPAAEVIDWSLPCPSIFERRRPLTEATLRRIAAGIHKFVLTAAHPFVVTLTHRGGDRCRDIESPLPTVTAAHRGEVALVAPSLMENNWNSRQVSSVEDPLKTITTQANRFSLIAPTIITRGYGEREGQAPRVPGLDKPLGTVVAGGAKHALVAAFLARHFGGVVGRGLDRPVPTVTAVDHHALVTGFLIKYYGTGGQQQGLFDPLHTVTSKARFGLVTVHGQEWQIVDLGLRMLSPRELFLAQGFPSTYEIQPLLGGRPLTKTEQILLAGNAVPPQPVEGTVAVNVHGGWRATA